MSDTSASSVQATLELQSDGPGLEGSLVDNARKIKREVINGKTYLVADAVLLTPGVHEGSEGPILYTPEGNVANASDWENQPIVVYHPKKGDKFVTVKSDPSILDTAGIGMVKNAVGTKDGRLKSKLYFEEEATKRVDIRVYNALVDGKQIELSTGILLQRQKAPEGSVYNGTDPYTQIAGKHIPDHVAVLPDQEGACSIKKGCGVLVNELSNHSSQDEKKSVWRKIGEFLGILTPTPVTNEAIRHADLRSELARQIRDRYEKGPMGTTLASYVYTYVEDVFDRKVVFTMNEDLYQLPYEKDNRTGLVTLEVGPLIKVRRVVTYKPVDSDMVIVGNEGQSEQGGQTMNREAIINELVANCDCWKHQGDKEVLNSFSDEKLLKLKENFDNQKRLTEVANAAKKGFESGQEGMKYTFNETTQKWEGTPTQKKPEVIQPNATGVSPVANQDRQDQQARLTPEEQEDILFARNQKNKMREEIINRLVANASEEKRPALAQQLGEESLAKLQMMEQLLPPAPVLPSQDAYPIPMANPVANWFGIQGGPAPVAAKAGEEEEPYAPPVMNFSTEKGADGVVRSVTSW